MENKYWNFQKNIDLFEYIIPLNIIEEKEKFISRLKNNGKYNPIFKYERLKLNEEFYLNNLLYFENEFKKYSNPISLLYLELIQKDLEWINHLFEREKSEFCEWLSELYGRPSYSLYTKALDTLKSIPIEEVVGNQITPNEMTEIVSKKLKERNFENWKIEIKNSSARISIDSITKTISIKSDSIFTISEIDRLVVHEIETHVLRYENGSKQKYLIFRKGFPNYLIAEEGLAILGESKNKVLLSNDLAKYCSRLIASYICFELDFSDTFYVINQYLNASDSFDIVARVKRGLIDTANCGGFTKDQIYYSGFLEVRNLPKEKIRKLFLGKISLEKLNVVDEIKDINYNVKLPSWVKHDD